MHKSASPDCILSTGVISCHSYDFTHWQKSPISPIISEETEQRIFTLATLRQQYKIIIVSLKPLHSNIAETIQLHQNLIVATLHPQQTPIKASLQTHYSIIANTLMTRCSIIEASLQHIIQKTSPSLAKVSVGNPPHRPRRRLFF